MTIFLAVLKVIGWILLILLLLLLLSIAALLFIPVRYQAQAEIQNGVKGTGYASWFLHLLQLDLSFDQAEVEAQARILFFRKKLYSSREEDPKPDISRDGLSEEEAFAKRPQDEPQEQDFAEVLQDEPQEQDFAEEPQDVLQKNRKKISPSHKKKEKRMHTIRKRVSLKERVLEIFQRIRGMFFGIQDNWKKAKVTIRKLKRMIQDEYNQKAVSHLKKETFLLLKALCPKRMNLKLQFSAGSPDITGQILGICALFPVAYQNKWLLFPDFESDKVYVSGQAHVKGKVFLYHIVAIVFRVILDKNCRRLYRMKNRYFG